MLRKFQHLILSAKDVFIITIHGSSSQKNPDQVNKTKYIIAVIYVLSSYIFNIIKYIFNFLNVSPKNYRFLIYLSRAKGVFIHLSRQQ